MMSFDPRSALRDARRSTGLTQGELAERAGLSRMTVQKIEAGAIDPRLSTLAVLVRALGLDLVLVPGPLAPAVEDFVRAGGRMVGQPAGIGAPPSIVDVVTASPASSARTTHATPATSASRGAPTRRPRGRKPA
jgi:transcriptional regulator with XRE-family HTH domain